MRHEFIQSYKAAPRAVDNEAGIESRSEDPTLREIDAELQSAQLAEAAAAAAAIIAEESKVEEVAGQ